MPEPGSGPPPTGAVGTGLSEGAVEADAGRRRRRPIVQLDEVDTRLIELLVVDGRATNRSLAVEVGLTEATVAARVRALQDRRILGVTAQRLVDTAIEAFGDLHGLVNNAGILRDKTVFNMGDDDWDTSLRVNARGTFMPTRAAARWWRDRSKSGAAVQAAVVNTSSESGVFANAGQSNYAAPTC